MGNNNPPPIEGGLGRLQCRLRHSVVRNTQSSIHLSRGILVSKTREHDVAKEAWSWTASSPQFGLSAIAAYKPAFRSPQETRGGPIA